eukprot:m.68263 g.68263  ORF g.68263 m.68263 type:complete len:1826 (+) comp11953_c0_seq2:265-5742(+)
MASRSVKLQRRSTHTSFVVEPGKGSRFRSHEEDKTAQYNTLSNLPYAVINLAIDRHNGLHLQHNAHETIAFRATEKETYSANTVIGEEELQPLPERIQTGENEESDLNFNTKDADLSTSAPKGNELGLAYQTWIEDNLRMHKYCVTPTPEEKDPSKCACGREIDLWGPHTLQSDYSITNKKDGLRDEKEKWHADTHCTWSPSTSYGLVTFKQPPPGFDLVKGDIITAKPFVRVSQTDCLQNPALLRELLVRLWDLEPPRIMLAVTGGAAAFSIPPKLDVMIRAGLANAAKSESMWITTGGTNSGVMKYVASAVADAGSFIPVIGFTSWSVVNNKEGLEKYTDGLPLQGGLTYYGDPDSYQPKPFCSLDRNHTHFVLVDDGTQDKFGGEIGARASIESSSAKLASFGKFGSESPIFTVLLAIQGGPGTVKTVLETLKQGTAVVIVNGSGKASNVIAYAMGLPLPGERKNSTGYTMEGLEELILHEFECHRESPMFEKIRSASLECIGPKFRHLIRIYTVDVTGEGNEVTLDVAILDAVLAHEKTQWHKWAQNIASPTLTMDQQVQIRLRERDLSRVWRLELALLWNQIRVVQVELSRYNVLPSLGKISSKMLYTTKETIAYMSIKDQPVTLKKGTHVELLKMQGPHWLVCKMGENCQLMGNNTTKGWVEASSLERKKGFQTFADSVILAQLHMLQWLLLNEKLDFVQLFLQGMREEDLNSFLSLRLRRIWKAAASEDVGISGTGRGLLGAHKDTIQTVTVTPALEDLDSDLYRTMRKESILSDGSKLQRERDARHMLARIKQFDDSDVAIPTHVRRWVKDIAVAHLQAWVAKKWFQFQKGFTLKPSTVHMLVGNKPNRPSPRRVEWSSLPTEDKENCLDYARWFVKYLVNLGYVITRGIPGKQLDDDRGLSRIHDAEDLAESIAETEHDMWLQIRLEDHWGYASKYNLARKESPYIKLFADLTVNDQEFCVEFAREQLRVLIRDCGFWIWRPDMLESLYADSALSNEARYAHVATLMEHGQFMRTHVHDRLGELIGADYVKDFSTFSALDPYYHLFVWAVISRRFSLASHFWKLRPQDAVVNALVGALVCHSLTRTNKSLRPETKSEYIEYAENLKNKALGVLRECAVRDSSKTQRMLAAQYKTAGWMTLWRLAYRLKNTSFTSHKLYIDVIKKEWFGSVDPSNGFLKLILGIVFPVYLILSPESLGIYKGVFRSMLNMISLRMDTTELNEIAGPAIIWSPTPRRVYLHHADEDATIHFTIDGTDPYVSSSIYVPDNTPPKYPSDFENTLRSTARSARGFKTPLRKRKPKKDDNGSDTESKVDDDDISTATSVTTDSVPQRHHRGRASVITLPPSGNFTIRAYVESDGLISAETVKHVNCDVVDLSTGTIPAFCLFPSKKSESWQPYQGFRHSLFRIASFYSAPYTKFWSELLFTMVYIILYSYASIVTTRTIDEIFQFDGPETTIPALVFLWTFIYITDEIRQLLITGPTEWASDVWNRWDFVFYVTSVVCFFLRIKYNNDTYQTDRLRTARILYSLGALMLWLRVSRLYALSPKLGPKLVMIGQMLEDVAIFVALLLIVLIGYGVSMHGILEPWRSFDAQSINTIFFKPTFHVIGETFLPEIQEHTHCIGEDFTQCNDLSNYVIVVLLVIYLLVSNIMLVNLLIAMMAATYSKVDEEANSIWSLQNVDLLEEFKEMLPLPPPLNFIVNAIHGVGTLYSKLKRKSRKVHKGVAPGDDGVAGQVVLHSPRTPSDIKFMQECTLRYFEADEARDRLNRLERKLEKRIDSRFGQLNSKVKDIEFNVVQLLEHLKVLTSEKERHKTSEV